MKFVLALGNPEPRYDNTRHNVGFAIVDRLAHDWGIAFKHTAKFQADIAEHTIDGEKILLVKPTTYYNEVGQSARAIADFYKLSPSDVIAVHDDVALPIGTIRTRIGGSDAGNNGIKSLNSHIGPHETARIRIGTHTDHRETVGDYDFVLGKFTAKEQQTITTMIPTIHDIIDSFARDAFATTTYRAQE